MPRSSPETTSEGKTAQSASASYTIKWSKWTSQHLIIAPMI